MTNEVYAAEYCPSLWESAYTTLSIHKTKLGAELAIALHKKEKEDNYYKLWGDDEEFMQECPFGWDEAWDVSTIELQE